MPLYIIAFLLPALTMWGGWILRAWLDGRFRVSVPENVRPAAELARHIIIGTALFALVFSTAAIINVLIDFFVQHHMAPEWLVMPTHILEAVFWCGDVLAFLLFTAVQLANFARQMLISAKRSSDVSSAAEKQTPAN